MRTAARQRFAGAPLWVLSWAPVWAAYHIYVSPHPVGGDIVHTEAVYLVDRRGYMRSGYLYPFVSGYVSSDLRVLARDKGA